MEKFKFLSHTADIKFQAYGKDLGEVFSNSALAMFNAMSKEKASNEIEKELKVSGDDLESLMYNFLEELLFLFDTEGFFLGKIDSININEEKFELSAEVSGEEIGKRELEIDVKAVTYNDMFVRREKDSWIAQVVVDV